jgi:hypothetical protein
MKKVTKRPRKGSTALVKKSAGLPVKAAESGGALVEVGPSALLSQAIDKGLPMDTIERLVALFDRQVAKQARDDFFAALSMFQSACPVIEKSHKVPNKKKNDHDKETVRYSYAAIEDLVAQAGPYLKEFGFSWTVKPEQTDKDVTAAVYAHHKDGHVEITKFTVPLDPAAYMSDPQKAAAALTFATRYAFKGAFGIQTRGEDNEAQQDEEPRRDTRKPFTAPQEKGRDAAVPVDAEVKLSEYEKGLKYLTATETAPNKQVVGLFTENEKLDYAHELKEAKDKPEELAKIIADIIETGKKHRAAVKGAA